MKPGTLLVKVMAEFVTTVENNDCQGGEFRLVRGFRPVKGEGSVSSRGRGSGMIILKTCLGLIFLKTCLNTTVKSLVGFRGIGVQTLWRRRGGHANFLAKTGQNNQNQKISMIT